MLWYTNTITSDSIFAIFWSAATINHLLSQLTYKNGDQYRMGNAYMLAWTYGYTRVTSLFYLCCWSLIFEVMSSFDFKLHDQGPPNQGAPNYAVCFTLHSWFMNNETVQYRRNLRRLILIILVMFVLDGFVNIDGRLLDRWYNSEQSVKWEPTLIHSFIPLDKGRAVTEIVTESNRIAFAREQNGFFAMNNADSDWNR